jgi:predicted DNA-binding transcriptional regulator AlpA
VTHEFLDPLLNEKQLAAWLGISVPSLQRMRSDGSGPPFVQLSQRRIAYKKSAVEHWLQERTITRVGEQTAMEQRGNASCNAETSIQ